MGRCIYIVAEMETLGGEHGLATDWRRLGHATLETDNVVDLLHLHQDQAGVGTRGYGVYLAVAMLILVVLVVYAGAQLLFSLGGLGGALGR